MAEADVAQPGNVDELGDGFANFLVKSAQPGMVQQGLVVFHQKMVELQIGRLSKDRNPINIRRDFRDDRHTALLNLTFSVTGARQTPPLTSWNRGRPPTSTIRSALRRSCAKASMRPA